MPQIEEALAATHGDLGPMPTTLYEAIHQWVEGNQSDPTELKRAVQAHLVMLVRDGHPDAETGIFEAVDDIVRELDPSDERFDQFVGEAVLEMTLL